MDLLGQVQILEVKDDPGVVWWPETLASVGGHWLAAHLDELLDDVCSIGLRAAVHHCNLNTHDALEAVLQQGALTTTLRPHLQTKKSGI